MPTEKRWVIVGKCGLYVGQELTRAAAVAAHVHAYRGKENVPEDISAFAMGRGLDPVQRWVWAWRKQCGDRVVRASIRF